MLNGGYAGQVLVVDLTTGEVKKEPLNQNIVERYIGGRGLTSYFHFKLIDPLTDPFSADNVLTLATGPLTGTLVPASGRFTAGARSPLTYILGDGSGGGHFAPEIKYAGYDALIIKGKASSPVYLWINDDYVEIRAAEPVWGLDTAATEDAIRRQLGEEGLQIASIGPAGEKLVRFAGIVVNRDHLAARTGMGAVMGSKNLKAIAIKGSRSIPLANPAEFKKWADELFRIITGDKSSGEHLPQYGTTSLLELHNSLGGLATRNWQTGIFEGHELINGDTLNARYLANATACYNCPCRCDRYSVVAEGPYAGTRVGGPEYYTIVSFGSKCGNSDLASILKANELANLYGLDTGTTGGVIAYAMELYEKGIISAKDTGGLELTWGNAQAIVELVRRIAFREGFGNLLAEGVRGAARQLGPAAEAYAITVKGMDPPTFDPRALKVYNFRYAIASRGADHLRISAHGAYELDKLPPAEAAKKLAFWQDVVCIPDMMGICKFPYSFYAESAEVTFKKILELIPKAYEAATGLPASGEAILKAARRVAELERAINVRYGVTPGDDMLPQRFLAEPMPDGPKKGQINDIFFQIKENFYREMGWDGTTGVPRAGVLQDLSMDEVIQDLTNRGLVEKMA